MQEGNLYDILACLKDIEQSIIEINEFLPEEEISLHFKRTSKRAKLLKETLR